MAESTPEKEYYRIDLTPTTKKITCLLCGDKKTQAVDRRKVLIGDEKTELGHLIERLLDISITAKTHSDTCCRNCERRLVTIEKSVNSFKGNYTSTQKQLETSHGKRITKRLASEHQIEPVSKRNLFASDTFEPATANEQVSKIILINY